MPFGGLVVNRLRVLARHPGAIDQSAVTADLGGDGDLAARSLRALRDLRALARRDAAGLRRLTGELEGGQPILVPQLVGDAGEVTGLLDVERFLFATGRERSTLLAEHAF